MPTMTNRPRLTSAQFLGEHRRSLEAVSDLYAAIEEMPILAAADPATLKHFFDELNIATIAIANMKIASKIKTDV